MTLRDRVALGMSLPHRSPDPLALTTIAAVARRAEELGFRDLWNPIARPLHRETGSIRRPYHQW